MYEIKSIRSHLNLMRDPPITGMEFELTIVIDEICDVLDALVERIENLEDD